MPKTILYRGLPGDGLDIFIQEYSEAARDDPFGTWLILPTERLVRKVTRDLVKNPGDSILSSHICTLQNFCSGYFQEHRTSTKMLKSAESRLLLQQILHAHRHEVPLFFIRGEPSPATLESLQKFMRVIVQRKIAYPSCLGDLQGEKSRQLGCVLSAYREQMLAGDFVDQNTILSWTAEHISSQGTRFENFFAYGIYSPIPLETDLLSAIRISSKEFTVFVPQGEDEKIFQGGDKWVGIPQRTEDVPPSRPTSSDISGLFREGTRLQPESGIRCATFATEYLELSRIADEISRLHENGVPFTDIAIGFPEVREKIGLLRDVFSDFNIPWSSAAGSPLNHLAIIQNILAIPGIVSREYSREAVLRAVQSQVYQTLRTTGNLSGIPDLDPRELDMVSRLAQIEKWETNWMQGFEYLEKRLTELEQRGDSLPVSKEMLARVQAGITVLFQEITPLNEKHRVREFTCLFREILNKWGVFSSYSAPDEDILTEEIAAKDKFKTCLTRVENLSDILAPEKVTCGEFLRILNSVTEEEVFLPEEPGTGVSILGIEESVNSRFPYLFLADLTDGKIPRLITRIPFTNQRENAQMGTLTLDEILREERYRFIAALLVGEKSVYLSAPQSDGENPLLSSAFFERVRAKLPECRWGETAEIEYSLRKDAILAGNRISEGVFETALPLIGNEHNLGDIAERALMEQYERDGTRNSAYAGIVAGDEWIRSWLLGEFGPKHVYSPTTLETYASCPICFFMRRVLNINPLPEVELNLSARDKGTAVHNILSTFYREWKSRGSGKVHLAELADATNLMTEIVTKELERYAFRSPAWEATCIQMKGSSGTGPGIFEKFLQKETEEEASPLVPSYFEFTFGMRSDANDDPASVADPVEISPGEETESIRIKGRVDRIDITPEGLFAIYDYKTGSQVASRIDIGAGKALQIPLYLLAYEKISGKQGVLGGYYRIRRDIENRIVLLDERGKDLVMSSNPRVTKDYRTVLLSSLKYSAGYIRGIRAGEFPLPSEEKCPNPYCEYSRVCRFDPSRQFTSPEGA